ncbi:REP-associated tyrosine transposase [Methyloprofundus sp.]|uniref:REP-associated tyrosine transposase n=1 Tax=Methyloprofundus sp. TaxID=2020875 RepID=UPI003D09BD27
MGKSRYQFKELKKPYFLTLTICGWQPIFTQPETVQIILDSWKYLQQESNFKLYGYVILENHIHLIAQSDNIQTDLQRFKSYTARQIIDFLKTHKISLILQQLAFYKKAHKLESEYQLWQEGSHPQVIESEDILRQKLEYMHNNPVKQGYVDKPEYWRYSSAGNYLGEAGLIEVFKAW